MKTMISIGLSIALHKHYQTVPNEVTLEKSDIWDVTRDVQFGSS